MYRSRIRDVGDNDICHVLIGLDILYLRNRSAVQCTAQKVLVACTNYLGFELENRRILANCTGALQTHLLST